MTGQPTTRPAPPPLVFNYPDCPMCGEETDGDPDIFYCSDCDATWSTRGNDEGQWNEPEAEQCASIDGRFLPGGLGYDMAQALHIAAEPQRCILTSGHTVDHADGTISWLDRYSATPEQLAVADIPDQTRTLTS
jgi:hypothetical protein